MLMWETFKPKEKGKHAVITKCEYNPKSGYYTITMRRGEKKGFKTFKAKQKPESEHMHISDVERAIKLANILDKELRRY